MRTGNHNFDLIEAESLTMRIHLSVRHFTAQYIALLESWGKLPRVPLNLSHLPEMRGNPKGKHSRWEKRHEEKLGIQEVFARVESYGESYTA